MTAAYIISLIYNLNKCSIMIVSIRASLKTRLIKEKTDRYDSCKETFRRRAVALQGRLTKQMSCIAVFSQKGFLEMPFIKTTHKKGTVTGRACREDLCNPSGGFTLGKRRNNPEYRNAQALVKAVFGFNQYSSRFSAKTYLPMLRYAA